MSSCWRTVRSIAIGECALTLSRISVRVGRRHAFWICVCCRLQLTQVLRHFVDVRCGLTRTSDLCVLPLPPDTSLATRRFRGAFSGVLSGHTSNSVDSDVSETGDVFLSRIAMSLSCETSFSRGTNNKCVRTAKMNIRRLDIGTENVRESVSNTQVL